MGSDLVVDLLDADLSSADIATGGAQVLHAGQRQLPQVTVLDAGPGEDEDG